MKPIYAFYGDDFTGSTDVLEQLAEGGIPAVLFLHAPDAELRARFSEARAIGLAGDSRSRPPSWMDAELPGAFEALSDAEIIHYKTCSTFDSSPEIGSIGRAIEIGRRALGGTPAIIVAAPYLRRYVVFGNLFAACGQEIFRIDRHPTMSRHPVTPMREADLIRHLAKQTDMRIGLVSLERLAAGEAVSAYEEACKTSDAVMFDGVSLEDLRAEGDVLLSGGVRFAVGSSGVTRALVMAWREAGLKLGAVDRQDKGAVDRMLVVSGSCSPATGRQISRAAARGYSKIRVDVDAVLRGESEEEHRLIDAAAACLSESGRCVIHSAEGPLDSAAQGAGDRLGVVLGRVANRVIRDANLTRVIFAGGDTSSYGVKELAIDALTWAAPLEPGVPLVQAHAADPTIEGLELALKGGQMGGEDFFETVRLGRSAHAPNGAGVVPSQSQERKSAAL